MNALGFLAIVGVVTNKHSISTFSQFMVVGHKTNNGKKTIASKGGTKIREVC
jgi:hypothetical protein